MNSADLYLNDFHRRNSMAAQREVQQMSLHPCSREQKLAQIQRIKEHSATTKESANLERKLASRGDRHLSHGSRYT